MHKSLKRALVIAAIAFGVVVGGTIALAQSDKAPATEEPGVEADVQFIGEPPGNNQTGEWEGEYEYQDEGEA